MKDLKANELVIDSREVSQMVGKRHCDLLRDIEKYCEYLGESVERNFALNEFFIKKSYQDNIRRTLPCYMVTKKGCELIAHKMTGKKGVQFTAEYINRFHEMEQSEHDIAHPHQLPQPIPKYFNGEPVITIRDLAEATGIDASVIRYHLKNCRAGIHYHVLTGSELADFKAENDEASSMNHLTVITKKGFVRLAKLIGRMPNKMECFQVEKHKEALPEAKHISGKADRLINEVHCCFDAAGVIMAIMRHHPSDIDAFRKVIEYVITSALVKALEI